MPDRSGQPTRPVAFLRHAAVASVVLLSLGLASLAQAAPPPQALVVTSGRSVLEGALAGLIVFPDGSIDGGELTTRLLPTAVRETDLLLWDVATDTVQSVPGFHPAILPYGWAGAYSSTNGQLQLARVEPTGTGKLVNHILGLESGRRVQLGAWLQEPGTVAVFSPVLGAVPEPSVGQAWPLAVLAMVSWARRRSARSAAAT